MNRKRAGIVASVTTLILLGVVLIAGCGQRNSGTDQKQSQETEKLVAEAHKQTGMPGITNFTERKIFKEILELRDTNLSTYTYIIDMHGKSHLFCESIGYGLPYSVQYTSPSKRTWFMGRTAGHWITMPQAEANGLFMPEGLSATWVLCVDGKGGVNPQYVEPQIAVTTFPLELE